MTIEGVLTKISHASALSVRTASDMYCAVCYQRAVNVVAIYRPNGDALPLCQAHFNQVEQAVQGVVAGQGGE
ncbi:MAG: hypothetical protein JW850_08075 [Thermoflexales bacterium]|nr:hypothetical protein [Thermoflexales bacterium]